jgi:hypothetical protein
MAIQGRGEKQRHRQRERSQLPSREIERNGLKARETKRSEEDGARWRAVVFLLAEAVQDLPRGGG